MIRGGSEAAARNVVSMGRAECSSVTPLLQGLREEPSVPIKYKSHRHGGFYTWRRHVCPCGQHSDAHGHEDVAVSVTVFVGVFGAHLAGGLGVLELQADFAGVADGLEEVDQVGGVEADDERVVVVGRLDGVFRLAGVGGGAGDA